MSRPIGVFDSGVGGLTVASVLSERFPEESIYYFGDTKRCPYGEKTQEQVKHFSYEIATWLKDHDAKMIVIACNTATAAALTTLKRAFSIPILGVIEAGARGCVSATRSGRIGILATQGTVSSNSYVDAIRSLMPEAEVYQQAAGSFVKIVESALVNDTAGGSTIDLLDTEEIHAEVRRVVSSLVDAKVDTICLGCTHFPVLAPIIAQEIPEDIVLVNPAYGVADEVGDLLSGEAVKSDQATYKFATTSDDTDSFITSVSHLFPHNPDNIEHVSTDELAKLDNPDI